MKGFGYEGKIPGTYEGMNCQTSGVIAWGDRNYGIDEFRSLVLAASDDTIEQHIGAGNGRPENVWAGPEIMPPHG